MSKSAADLIFAGRGQEDGVFVRRGVGLGAAEGLLAEAPKPASDNSRSPGLCRVLKFSHDGRFFAYCDGHQLRVLPVQDQMADAAPAIVADLPRTTQIVFSPKSNFIATFQPYAVYNKDADAQGEPNLRIWDLATGQQLKAFIQRKAQNWTPSWSDDESVCARLVGSEVMFHEALEGGGFWEKYTHKYKAEKLEAAGLSPGEAPLHFLTYKPVSKGQPGTVTMLGYPGMQVVSNKTFWKADRVSFSWNTSGKRVIVMAITDVDSTGQSYYGEQTLFLMGTDGDSAMVPLGKNGPVYAVEWSPRGNGFCVVYGYMPAKATLYNQKGEPVFDFGTGPRNEVHYNCFGTILVLTGFGNLRGNMEFWSVRERKLIKQFKAEDTTQFAWAPDGEHFITATTAPRLRVNNGWKIWHYSGNVITSWAAGEGREFWEATFCPDPGFSVDDHKIVYPPPTPPVSPSQGDNPLAGLTKKGAYLPPHLRGDKAAQARAKKFTIHDIEAPTKLPDPAKGRGRGGGASNGSRAPGGEEDAALAGAEQRAKKIKNVQRKLDQVKLLKHRQDCGEELELNQLEKIKKEAEFLTELENLELS